LRAALRRREVLKCLVDYGWTYGCQIVIARQLGVSEATISRDVARLLPLMEECPTYGGLTPRQWWKD
jgi:hypothetical protein